MDSLSEMVGLKLDAARVALAGSTPSQELRVVETNTPPHKNAPHTFGEWRVLRARNIEENQTSIVELTVARELLEHARR